jgi:hypothetical protein
MMLSSKDLPPQRHIRLFAELLSIENKLDKIITAVPEWNVSKGLAVCDFILISSSETHYISFSIQTNIDSYVVAVLLSSSLHAYKGETTTNHVLVSSCLCRETCPLTMSSGNLEEALF